MSGIVGILNLNGTPVPADKLHSMVQSIIYRGPDGKSSFIQGNVGLGQTLLITTPQVHQSDRPFVLGNRYHIVADATLYNREELSSKLHSRNSPDLSETPDCVLILEAYIKWGIDCPNYLVGDFSFAIFDVNTRQLFIARDPMGIRQLYYSQHKNQLLFATDIAAILDVLPQEPPLNRQLLTEILLEDHQHWDTETTYQNIYQLASGCRMIAKNNIRIDRYYDLKRVSPIRYKTDGEYIEHFDEVFSEAVGSRLRSSTQVGLVVSGGVDSSTVTAITRKLVQRCQLIKATPVFYSFAGKSSQECDDWHYLQELLEYCDDWKSNLIDGDQLWALKQTVAEENYNPAEPEIDLTRHGMIDILHLAKGDGTRVLVTGHGGDQIMCGDAYHYPSSLSLLPKHELRSEWKHFKLQSGYSNLELFVNGILKPSVRQIIHPGLLTFLKSQRTVSRTPDWIQVAERRSTKNIARELFSKSKAIQNHGFDVALDGGYQRAFAVFDYGCGLHHTEYRYPFYDMRLIELILGLPTNLFFRNGQTKWILRQITEHILPDTLRNRSTFCNNQEWIDKGWRHKEKHVIDGFLNSSRAAELGLVNPEKLQESWNRYLEGDYSELWNLSAWINIEKWLRNH